MHHWVFHAPMAGKPLPCPKIRKIHQTEKENLLPLAVSSPRSLMSSPNIALADKKEMSQGPSPGAPSKQRRMDLELKH